MRYVPETRDNVWVTATADANEGIHCQRSFRDGVLMLETAIDEYTHPKLVHLTIKGSSDEGYATFIDKLTRKLREKAKVPFSFKGCHEDDVKKANHIHLMFVVDSNNVEALFDEEEESLVSDLLWNGRDKEPTLDSFLATAKLHGTKFISLSDDTLQDAACWLSYIYKLRSKPDCHKYLSSRRSRRKCAVA